VKPPFDLQTCWPPELRLVAAAARPSARCDRTALERELATALDWSRVEELGARHRLLPLLHANLEAIASVPPDVRQRLRAACHANTAASLLRSRELARLTAAFRRAGITAVSYKGAALAQRLYGNVGLRCFDDLDLLVAADERERAAAVLREFGYEPYRSITERERQELADCEEQYVECSGGSVVDLHWAVAQPYLSMGPLPAGWRDRLRTLPFAGEAIPVFGSSEELLVLALHGGKHRWARLAWLADFAAALETEDFEWKALLAAAGEMRICYHVLLAATLAHFCFGIPVPRDVLAQAHATAVPWHYAAEIARSLGSVGEPSLLKSWRYNLRMRERWSDRVRAAMRFTLRPTSVELDERAGAAPMSSLLYPAVRAAKVATRALKAAVGGRTERG
jgi:hypothetical protein